MEGMTIAFHAVATVAFIGMAFLLLRGRQQRELMRALLRSPGQKAKVHVDWPEHFLMRFGAAFAVPVSCEGAGKTTPKRLNGERLVELFLSQGISLIRCKINSPSTRSTKPLTVEFHLVRPVEHPEPLAQELSAALGGGVDVRLAQHSVASSVS